MELGSGAFDLSLREGRLLIREDRTEIPHNGLVFSANLKSAYVDRLQERGAIDLAEMDAAMKPPADYQSQTGRLSLWSREQRGAGQPGNFLSRCDFGSIYCHRCAGGLSLPDPG